MGPDISLVLIRSQDAHGIGWWSWPQDAEGNRPGASCKLNKDEGGWLVAPPLSPLGFMRFLGILGRKYSCDSASLFLRKVGRDRVRSGATRPLGKGSPGGFALVLERKTSARLAQR